MSADNPLAPDTPSANLIHSTPASWEADLKHPGLVLADFWAPWCGPCKILGPTLERMAATNPAFTLVKIDVDEIPAASMAHQVLSIPTVIFFKDGVQVGEPIIGVRKPQEYAAIIEQHCA